MIYSETDIEEYLWDHPDALSPYVDRWYARQLRVPSGRIDLIGVTHAKRPVVVEVKKEAITADALAQVCRYSQDIDEAVGYLWDKYSLLGDFEPTRPRVLRVVVGRALTDSHLLRAAEGMRVAIFTFEPSLYLNIGQQRWTPEFANERHSAVRELSAHELFTGALEEIREYNNSVSVTETDGRELEPTPHSALLNDERLQQTEQRHA